LFLLVKPVVSRDLVKPVVSRDWPDIRPHRRNPPLPDGTDRHPRLTTPGEPALCDRSTAAPLRTASNRHC